MNDEAASSAGVAVPIRDGYAISYSPEYLEAGSLTVRGFSKIDFPAGPGVARKYLGQVTSRAYYPSGRKKWFYSLMYRYEFVIPKAALSLDPDRSGSSFIHYRLGDLELVNSTSGGGGSSCWVDWQSDTISHCRMLTAGQLRTLEDHAVPSRTTIPEARDPFEIGFDVVTLMVVATYANDGATTYSKATKSYRHFYPHRIHPFVADLLEEGCRMTQQTLDAWGRAIINGTAPPGTLDILHEYLCWMDAYPQPAGASAIARKARSASIR